MIGFFKLWQYDIRKDNRLYLYTHNHTIYIFEAIKVYIIYKIPQMHTLCVMCMQ